MDKHVMVPVREPFDLGLSMKFLGGFSPMTGEVGLRGDALSKAWLHEGQLVDVAVRRTSSGLSCALRSADPITDATARAVADRVAFFLGASDDVEAFHAIAERDRAFAPVARRLRGLHHPKFPTPFESACWALLNQRIGLAQARRMKAALVVRFGAGGAFPEPKTLAHATEAEIRAVVTNERKARAVGSAARAFERVDEKWLQTAPIDEVDAWVRRIWGVGDFGAAFILFRGLGRSLPPPLGLPWSDGFVEAAKRTYGADATRASLAKKAASYGPWLGYWSLYLWASTFVRGSESLD